MVNLINIWLTEVSASEIDTYRKLHNVVCLCCCSFESLWSDAFECLASKTPTIWSSIRPWSHASLQGLACMGGAGFWVLRPKEDHREEQPYLMLRARRSSDARPRTLYERLGVILRSPLIEIQFHFKSKLLIRIFSNLSGSKMLKSVIVSLQADTFRLNPYVALFFCELTDERSCVWGVFFCMGSLWGQSECNRSCSSCPARLSGERRTPNTNDEPQMRLSAGGAEGLLRESRLTEDIMIHSPPQSGPSPRDVRTNNKMFWLVHPVWHQLKSFFFLTSVEWIFP